MRKNTSDNYRFKLMFTISHYLIKEYNNIENRNQFLKGLLIMEPFLCN